MLCWQGGIRHLLVALGLRGCAGLRGHGGFDVSSAEADARETIATGIED